MDRITGIKTFIGVVEAGSFTAAADRLGMSTALASKYVGQLEDLLGVRLLNRTTRSLTLTEIGKVYFDRSRQLVDDFDELDAAIRDKRENPSGKLVVTAPVTFGELYLTPAIGRFLEHYPEISVDLQLSDRFISLAEEGVDLAIRIAEMPDETLISRKLSSMRTITCAAPDYIGRFGKPEKPADLVNHQCVIDTNKPNADVWPYKVKGQIEEVRVKGRFSVNSAKASRDVVLAGGGVGLIPGFAVSRDIEAGRIVPILEDYEARDLGIYALYLHRRHLAVKVRVFIDFLVQEFSEIQPH